MHADRFDHFGSEPLLQLVGTDSFMSGIDSAIGDVFTQVVDQMAVVMKEAGYNHFRRLAGLLGEGGALKRMLKFSDVFPVAAMPFGSEDSVDFTDDLIGFGRVHGMRAGTGSSRSMDKEIAKSKFKPREIVAEIVSEGEACHENVTQAWMERSGRVRSHQWATAPE
jgi:hypothetical protein